MKRKLSKRLLIGFPVLVTVWLVVAQFTMKYRISDKKAKEEFLKENIILDTGSINVDGFEIHYALSLIHI